MARYKRKSYNDKKKQIDQLSNSFLEKLDSYFISEESLKEHLEFMGRFHNYSFRNSVLIDNQFSGARAVGSYNFWKEQGVNVKKGEKGIQILAPTPIEYFKRDNDWVQKRYASKKEKEEIKKGSLETKNKMFFKVGHVFEYTQTNAREKGIEESDIFKQYHRDGSLENDKALISSLEKVADNLNVTILDEPKYELGTAKGASYPYLKEIALNPRNSEYEDVTVLIHELAHAKLHTPETRHNYTTAEKEFQAEMVSHVVSSHYGIDSEEFSLSYLHGWTQGKELEDKEQLLNEVKQTSKEFIDTIDNNLEQELKRERNFSMNNKVNVKSLNAEYSDEFEFATITYTNGMTGKENDFSVWSGIESDVQITKEDLRSGEMYVFMNSPSVQGDSSEGYSNSLDDNMYESNLYDLIDVDDEVEQALVDYHNGEIDDFNIEIPIEKQTMESRYVVVDEEITDILLKNELDEIDYNDIVDLGKTLENFEMEEFNFNFPENLSENFNKEMMESAIEEEDLKHINTAFEKMDIKPEFNLMDNLSLNETNNEEKQSKLFNGKGKQKMNNEQSQKDDMEFGMGM